MRERERERQRQTGWAREGGEKVLAVHAGEHVQH